MKIEVKIPVVGESITEVTIGKWLKKTAETVAADEVICAIESEKATIEVVAEQAGVLNILVPAGDTRPIGAVIATIDTEAVPAAASGPVPSATKSVRTEVTGKKARATPVAEKILHDAGLDSTAIAGTGPGGRITKSDAIAAIQTPVADGTRHLPPVESTPMPEQRMAPPVPETIAVSMPGRSERRERMSTLRKTIARRLVAAKNETAMLTTINEIDMSAIIALRSRYKDSFQEKYGVRLGFMGFFVRAVCLAINEYPVVNAIIDGDDIVFHDFCDIGIAVAAPRGLVVPMIRNAGRLSLAEIERQVAYLADKARDNKLTLEEMTGGTFSITNGGVFGSLISTPIINAPQSAILGMHTLQDRPVALNGQVVIRPMMYVSLSYDHRIIDGRESVLFLVRVKQLLEDPGRMLLEI